MRYIILILPMNKLHCATLPTLSLQVFLYHALSILKPWCALNYVIKQYVDK